MKNRKIHISLAQAASELAIFGAILIFVLGLIIRYAVNFNYAQNQSLAALRYALQQSWLSANTTNTPSRATASVLYIEDRKDVDAASGGLTSDGKFGSLARTPNITAAAGSFSKAMFQYTNYGAAGDLPLMDMFINGQHFSFTTAGYVDYKLMNNAGDGPNVSPDNLHYDWDPTCTTSNGGCVVLYFLVPNPSREQKYKALPSGSCNSACIEKRFDLDRDGTSDVPAGLRPYFSWQWMAIKATNANIKLGCPEDPVVMNVSLDADNDLKEEQVMKYIDKSGFVYTEEECPLRLITDRYGEMPLRWVGVLDSGAGDLDSSYGGWDSRATFIPAFAGVRPARPRPGLTNETVIYTYTNTGAGEGTYLQIVEGKLYTPNKQYVRDVQKRDAVDVIERRIQLSNDTGRFCTAANAPSAANPSVEVCGNCYSQANIFRTCFDRATKILYVRSRLSDKGGRKWITDTSSDRMLIR